MNRFGIIARDMANRLSTSAHCFVKDGPSVQMGGSGNRSSARGVGARIVVAVRFATAFGLVCLLSACGADDVVFAMRQKVQVTGEQAPMNDGTGCEAISEQFGSSSGIGFGPDGVGRPDIWEESETTVEGMALKIGSGNTVLKNLLFRKAFFVSGQVERLWVVTLAGNEFVYTLWGSSNCDRCAPDSPNGSECGVAEAVEFANQQR